MLDPSDGLKKHVIFRMDDINNDWAISGQLALLNLFISKRQRLTAGIIMNQMTYYSDIARSLSHGNKEGLFELAIHGWDHIDYTRISKELQKDSLIKANDRMNYLFRIRSDIFIAPYGRFNTSTLEAMNRVGIRILSSITHEERNFNNCKSIFVSTQSKGQEAVFHIPATVYFKYRTQGKWVKVQPKTILSNILLNVLKFGYAVVLFHPQDFMQTNNGCITDILDIEEIEDLSHILDCVMELNMDVTSLSGLIKRR